MKTQLAEVIWAKSHIQLGEYFTSEHPFLRRKGFYAILSAIPLRVGGNRLLIPEDLLYVGQSFDQAIRDRIDQEHKADACIDDYLKEHPRREILLKAGVISQAGQKTLTQELFNDVECCLIYSNSPKCNVQCRKAYKGRPIVIVNKGDYSPLVQQSFCIPMP